MVNGTRCQSSFSYTYRLTEFDRVKKIWIKKNKRRRRRSEKTHRVSDPQSKSVCVLTLSRRDICLHPSLFYPLASGCRLCYCFLMVSRRAVIMPLGLVTIHNLQGHGAPDHNSAHRATTNTCAQTQTELHAIKLTDWSLLLWRKSKNGEGEMVATVADQSIRSAHFLACSIWNNENAAFLLFRSIGWCFVLGRRAAHSVCPTK